MKTVLIIEDDRAVAATYRHKFKEAGFLVEVAPDGIEGVRLVSTLRPDAVVLDLLMPRLDGIEVLKFIRGHPDICNTPVVVFSNSYMTNLVESAWRASADECLMKASTMPAKLLDTVHKIMSRPNRRRAQGNAPGSNPIAPTEPGSFTLTAPKAVVQPTLVAKPAPVAQPAVVAQPIAGQSARRMRPHAALPACGPDAGWPDGVERCSVRRCCARSLAGGRVGSSRRRDQIDPGLST